MHRLDCDEYVDMGEHNKPLCKKNGYRPAECELCPMRVAALEAENAKLRELVETMHGDMREMLDTIDRSSDVWGFCRYFGECLDCAEGIMRELRIEVGE